MDQKLNIPFSIKTYGCQMNVYDSSRIERLLDGEGCTKVDNPRDAKLIIINTCTVREKARHKVLSILGTMRPLKENNPDLIIAVAGCVAQQEGKRLLTLVPFLDIVLGPDNIDSLPNLVRKAKERERVVAVDFSDEEQLSLKPLLPVQGKRQMASAFITVATGCNKKCTFCIVPFVRGIEKCRSPEELIEECRTFIDFGVKEIILVGQTVNAYKHGSTNFADLLKQINDLPGLERLRFLTSHPIDMSDDIIACFGELEHLCEALHLPVQSGSNSVLKRMLRRYTREEYIEIVDKIREKLPNISLTTDIIVGFPGEDEEEFEETITLLEKLKFDGSYSFIYSPRPGLPSAKIPDKTPLVEKENRLNRYITIQNDLILKTNSEYIGKSYEVLVEGPSNTDKMVMNGRTRSNKLIHFPGDESLIGQLIPVKMTKAFSSYIRGELQI